MKKESFGSNAALNSRRSLIKRNPEFCQWFESQYKNVPTWPEKIYWYKNNMTEYPNCKHCGKPLTKFYSQKHGYRSYCSFKCSNLANRKFGEDNVFGKKEIQQKIRETNLKKYGVEYPQQNASIRNKTKENVIAKYGGEGLASPEISQKIIRTCVEKYGVSNVFMSEKFKNDQKKRIIEDHDHLIGYTIHGDWICKCPHLECNKCNEKQYITKSEVYRSRNLDDVEQCTKLHPISSHLSHPEWELREFIKELGFNPEKNRTILNGMELDIYIPEKKIAIEFNGVYWHSSEFKSPKYHFNKFKKCLDAGIQLITIWEDQWRNKKEICKEIIKSKLGIYNTRLYARKCDIVEVKSCKSELDTWHLQGWAPSKYNFVLKYNNEPVAIMTFGVRKISNIPQFELIRFCSKPGIQVVGGASKLFKHFIEKYNPPKIISYSSNDISTGTLYGSMGFTKVSESISYWYIDKQHKRYHRSNFRKCDLIKKGCPIDMSEHEWMSSQGYLCIYDCGQTKWEFINNNSPH